MTKSPLGVYWETDFFIGFLNVTELQLFPQPRHGVRGYCFRDVWLKKNENKAFWTKTIQVVTCVLQLQHLMLRTTSCLS